MKCKCSVCNKDYEIIYGGIPEAFSMCVECLGKKLTIDANNKEKIEKLKCVLKEVPKFLDNNVEETTWKTIREKLERELLSLI